MLFLDNTFELAFFLWSKIVLLNPVHCWNGELQVPSFDLGTKRSGKSEQKHLMTMTFNDDKVNLISSGSRKIPPSHYEMLVGDGAGDTILG